MNKGSQTEVMCRWYWWFWNLRQAALLVKIKHYEEYFIIFGTKSKYVVFTALFCLIMCVVHCHPGVADLFQFSGPW